MVEFGGLSLLADPSSFANVKNNNHWVKQEHRIRVEQKLLVGTERSSNRLEVGNHELDFEFQVPGHIYESIEGLPYSWLVYRLKAELERGVLARKLVSRKHIRIIRTFEPTSLALFQEAVSTQIVLLALFTNFAVRRQNLGRQDQIYAEHAYRSSCVRLESGMCLCSHPSQKGPQNRTSPLTTMGANPLRNGTYYGSSSS